MEIGLGPGFQQGASCLFQARKQWELIHPCTLILQTYYVKTSILSLSMKIIHIYYKYIDIKYYIYTIIITIIIYYYYYYYLFTYVLLKIYPNWFRLV